MSENILEVKDLVDHFETDDGCVKAINGLTFSIGKEKTLGLVGETGAGKTSTALAALNLIPDPPGVIKSGTIKVCGNDILTMKQNEHYILSLLQIFAKIVLLLMAGKRQENGLSQ